MRRAEKRKNMPIDTFPADVISGTAVVTARMQGHRPVTPTNLRAYQVWRF
jgi:hypothetical protein